MRQLLWDYYGGRLPRREFFRSLVAAGITAGAARSLLQAAERGGSDNAPPAESGAYQVTGSGADLILEQVKAAGTRFLFVNPGSVETAFYDALTDRPELQLIMGLHEGVVLSMADGYHKVSQQPAFVNVHAVAGTGQIGGQMFNVHRDGSSLVITAGMNDTTTFSDDLHLAPAAGFNQIDINQQFTKLSWEVRNGAGGAVATRRAYKLAAMAPGGPVYVAFSRSALEEKTTGEIWPRETFLLDARPRPAKDQIERLARMLIEAERPAIVFGDEVWRSGGQTLAVDLAERMGLVAASGQQAFANFPMTHPQYVGGLRPSQAYPFGGHDLVVQFGARDPGGAGIPGKIRTADRYVAVGLDTEMIGRTQPLDLAVVADTRAALADLLDAVTSLATRERLQKIRDDRTRLALPAIAEARAKREAEARANFENAVIHPDRLDYELDRAIPARAIVATETLTARESFMRFGHRDHEKMRLRSNGTSLGWGVGAAIGAQLAAPDRQVVLSIGDGSVMYSASGFWTMARHSIPVLTVVWNNRNYQTVRHAFAAFGGRMAQTGHYHGMHLGDPDLDFVKLAESQGVAGARVTRPGDLEGALKRALQETAGGRPYLLEVLISNYGAGADSTWYQEFKLGRPKSTSA